MDDSLEFSTLSLETDQGLNEPRQISEKFRSGSADVTFVSFDNILFYIHRKNLEANAGAFPPAEFDTRGEIVQLTENSATLELLFQYIYPMRHPELEDTPFETLAPLAEAAEKYEVFSAMSICKIRMKQTLPEHAVEIFNYASRHGYKEIMGLAAPFLLDIATDENVKTLAPELVVPWIRYRECWGRAAFKVVTELEPEYKEVGNSVLCGYQDGWGNNCQQVYSTAIPGHLWVSLGEKRSLGALMQLYDGKVHSSCGHYNFEDRRKRLEQVLKAVPSFDTFL